MAGGASVCVGGAVGPWGSVEALHSSRGEYTPEGPKGGKQRRRGGAYGPISLRSEPGKKSELAEQERTA